MENSQFIKGKTWEAIKIDHDYIFSINYDEKLIASFEDFSHHINIQSASITGIGAVSEATLGIYNPTTKDFDKQTFKEQMELAGAIGNVSYKDDELYVHIHVTLGRKDYTSYSGHLVEATIHGAGEFYVRTYPYKAIKTDFQCGNMWLYDLKK